MMNISNHLNRRIRERVHIPKKSVTNFLKKAMLNGLYIEDITNRSVRNYMLETVKEGYYGIIYGRYLIIFTKSTDIGITILNVPKSLFRIIDNIKNQDKGDNYNAKGKRYCPKDQFPKEWSSDLVDSGQYDDLQ